MSWSEGRSATGEDEAGARARKEALNRVDAILCGLAKDELLHDDLQHPDVQKALQHWTGQNRLSQDEADELMEDNYRIQAVFSKMAELQRYCKEAGIGIPLAKVVSRQGLYEGKGGNPMEAPSRRSDPASPATGGAAANPPGSLSASAAVAAPKRADTATPGAPSYGSRGDNRSPLQSEPEARAHTQAQRRKAEGAAAEKGLGEMTWQQALVEELWKMMAVLVCAFVFSLALKYFKGDSTLDSSQASTTSEAQGGQSGQALSPESNEF